MRVVFCSGKRKPHIVRFQVSGRSQMDKVLQVKHIML